MKHLLWRALLGFVILPTMTQAADLPQTLPVDTAVRIGTLDNGLKYTPITATNRDAQFIETKAASIEDIGRLFNIPLYKLGVGKQTYASNVQAAIEYMQRTLSPIVSAYEQEDTYKLLVPGEQARGLQLRRNMMGELRGKADLLMLKLSPMLDWHEVARQLGGISELHIVSVRNECKEIVAALLSPASAGMSGDEIGENNATAVHCVNDGSEFVFIAADASQRDARQGCAVVAEIAAGDFLYVPNASVMKAGCFGEIASRYGMTQVSANSHLFVSPHFTGNFPGRVFLINAISSMNRRELRKALGGISCANVAVRNFPLTAERLRRRLGLSDGGDDYLFATTDCDGRHIVLLCRKATPPDGGAAGT